jgi:hypothetical protein
MTLPPPPPPPRWLHICSAERTLTPQIPLHEQNKLSVNRARIQLAFWIAANRKQLAPPPARCRPVALAALARMRVSGVKRVSKSKLAPLYIAKL